MADGARRMTHATDTMTPSRDKTRTVETSIGWVTLNEDEGFIELTFREGVEAVLEDMVEIVECVEKLSPHLGTVPVLANLAGLYGHSPEARAFYAKSDKANRIASKVAVLTESMLSRVLANGYLRYKYASTPTRIFNDRAEAIAWLKEPLE
jgi:hypothetical protein